MKFSVIKTGGKQYIVKVDDELHIDRLAQKANDEVEFDCLATIDTDKDVVELGKPVLKHKVKAKILELLKGEKIRVARFKSKVRSRKVKGFRHFLTKIKILSV